MPATSSQRQIASALRHALRRQETAGRPAPPVSSTGSASLDRLLPPAGLPRGTLVEYLAEAGSSATALALIAAREACREMGALVVIDHPRSFYPPAAGSLGLDLSGAIFIRPPSHRDHLWAWSQALGCQGVGAVVGWPDHLSGRAFRSLQLAAERGGTLGLFVRPLSARGHPAWSELQLLVETRQAVGSQRRLHVEVLRCRNGQPGAAVEVELNDETGTLQDSCTLRLDSSLAARAPAAHASRA